MPSVDVAMARSLRGGVVGSLVSSLNASIGRRQLAAIPGQINDAKTAFSSWDNCMAANFCKWPVIALMIVGGLIIFSVIWCLARCLCCGLSCCCQCFYCLKCCGNCCGCCDTPKGTPHRYLDDPYLPPQQGYKTQAPMHAPVMPSAAAAVHSSPPQYAEFDVSRKGDADSLPAMPSWETAGSKKIMLDDEVEMDHLKKPDAAQSSQSVPLMAGGATPGPASPLDHSPYGNHQIPASASGYLGAGAAQSTDPYAATPSRNYLHNDPYAQSSSSLGTGLDQGYGMAAAGAGGAAMAGGRRQPDYNDPYAQQSQGYAQGRGQPEYDNGFETGGYGMGGGQRRSPPGGRPSPGPGAEYRRSPAPPSDYGYGQERPYGGGAGGARQYPPAPRRQYTSESNQPASGYGNSGGRSQDYDYTRNASSSSQQLPPSTAGSDYPGFKAYQPAQQGWSGV